jgi:hypothetical protein
MIEGYRQGLEIDVRPDTLRKMPATGLPADGMGRLSGPSHIVADNLYFIISCDAY